jgi:hypothetical protein
MNGEYSPTKSSRSREKANRSVSEGVKKFLSKETENGEIYRGDILRLRCRHHEQNMLSSVICVLGEKFHLRLFNYKAPHSLKLERKVEGYQVRIPDRILKSKLEEIRMTQSSEFSNNQEVHTYLLLYNPSTKIQWTKNPIIFCMGLSHKDAWLTAFLRCLQVTNNGYQLTMSIVYYRIYI